MVVAWVNGASHGLFLYWSNHSTIPRMLPLQRRIGPILGLLLGAPVCAEYLQVYLPSSGDARRMLTQLLILGPLYGGSALLIREAALRRRLGWRGRLGLATAFGLAMTAIVDLSLWTPHRPDVPYWDDLMAGTRIDALGVSLGPLVSWVSGHVLFSVGVPLALLDALAPRHRNRPLLGRWGLVVVAALAVAAAALIHGDTRAGDTLPGPGQAAAVFAVLAALVAVVLAALRPTRPGTEAPGRTRPWPPAALVVVGFVAAVASGLVGFGWGSVAFAVVTLGAAAIGIRHWSRRPGWGIRHATALATGALLARCGTGFLAPVPPGVEPAAALTQSLVLLTGVGVVSALAWRAARASDPLAAPRAPAPGPA